MHGRAGSNKPPAGSSPSDTGHADGFSGRRRALAAALDLLFWVGIFTCGLLILTFVFTDLTF